MEIPAADWQVRWHQEHIRQICEPNARSPYTSGVHAPTHRVWEGEWRQRGRFRRDVRPVAIRVAFMMEAADDGGRWLEADWEGAPCYTVWERPDGSLWPSAAEAAGY